MILVCYRSSFCSFLRAVERQVELGEKCSAFERTFGLIKVFKTLIGHIHHRERNTRRKAAFLGFGHRGRRCIHTEKAKFVSLRNPFEDNLCQTIFKDDRILNRTPFDFSSYITTYAYLLVETGANIDAIPVLETAIEYNPVDVAPRFELCEVYKLIRNKRMVIEVTRDTLKVASSPVAIARCYANIGYILTSFADFEDAGVFYTASVMFAPNKGVAFEMQHLSDLKGSPIIRPTQQQLINTMKKYDIEFGPDKTVIEVCAQLSSYFLSRKDFPNALQALKMTYNLTRDEHVKELILKIDPNSPMFRPAQDAAPQQ